MLWVCAAPFVFAREFLAQAFVKVYRLKTHSSVPSVRVLRLLICDEEILIRIWKLKRWVREVSSCGAKHH